VSHVFPNFVLNGADVQFVSEFKYLGFQLSVNQSKDADVMREIQAMFTRTNILIRRLSKCSVDVKTVLFRSYCLSFYSIALWKKCTVRMNKKLSYRRETARQLRIHAQLTRCFSAVAV